MFDAIQFCKDHGVEYRTSGKNVSDGWVGINDIYQPDSSFHMGINIEGGYVYSWKSGGHRLEEVIKDLLTVSYPEARKLIQDYSSHTISLDYMPKTPFEIATGKPTKAMRTFLCSRRYNATNLIEKYDLRGNENRLVIPVYFNNRIVSYQERDITKKFYKSCPKNMSIMNYKDILYPMDYAKKSYVVVVEGIFDAYRLGDNAVCTFGTSWTRKQLQILAVTYETIIVMFDNEAEAQRKGASLVAELSMMGCDAILESSFLQAMQVNDPDELTNKQARIFMELLDNEYDI
jgi:hypothetical protein